MLEELGLRLKKQLIDTGMIDAIKLISSTTGVVNIDINDIKTFDNKVLTSVIDFETDTMSDDISILKVSDFKPTDAIIAVISKGSLPVDAIGRITAKIESQLRCDLNIILGVYVDSLQLSEIRVIGLLGADCEWTEDEDTLKTTVNEELFRDRPVSLRIESDEVLANLDKNPKPTEVLRFPTPFDKDLFYYTKTMIEKDLTTIYKLQDEFDISFQKASKAIQALEQMKILSERGSDGKRRFIITNSRDIYNIICNTGKFVSDDEKLDKIYQAGQYVLASGDTSIGGIQARFNMTFGEASGIIGKLEAYGIISVKNGINPRKILINNVHEVYLKIYGSENN
ncbi:MAG: hypothetical protein IJP63_03265 [Acholeplasmatales bacterium]|nr:hypothetical protein [Acholeplasmatales bacterium]